MKRDRQQQEILGEAVRNAFLKLDPRIQWKNPVMFIVFLGAILVAVLAVRAFMAGNTQEGWFDPAYRFMAVVYGSVCQFCRSRSRRPRQSAGRKSA